MNFDGALDSVSRIPFIRCCLRALSLLAVTVLAGLGEAGEFKLADLAPNLDRWMYPFGDFDGSRPAAPTWASFDQRFDTRDGQFLLAWDTANRIATNAPARNYWVTRLRITVEHTPLPSQPSFVYDPTYDDFRTYLTNVLAIPDADTGRPVELYGVAYRGGYTAVTFNEASPFGAINSINNPTNVSIGTRNAFAADFGDDGQLRDISNNVGQADEPFEVTPFAVGQTSTVAPGDEVPDGTRFSFEVDLNNPLVLGYVQASLQQGRLPLMLSSLHRARAAAGGIGVGGGVYPNWVTRENLLGQPAALQLEGALISNLDTDADGLPDDWEQLIFGDLSQTSAGDFDGDGANNLDEFRAGTDPKKSASRFAVVDLQAGPGIRASLRFTYAASRQYRVETSDRIGGWSLAAGRIQFFGNGEAVWNADTASDSAEQYFRVVVTE